MFQGGSYVEGVSLRWGSCMPGSFVNRFMYTVEYVLYAQYICLGSYMMSGQYAQYNGFTQFHFQFCPVVLGLVLRFTY
jgi:hypothetical protein